MANGGLLPLTSCHSSTLFEALYKAEHLSLIGPAVLMVDFETRDGECLFRPPTCFHRVYLATGRPLQSLESNRAYVSNMVSADCKGAE